MLIVEYLFLKEIIILTFKNVRPIDLSIFSLGSCGSLFFVFLHLVRAAWSYVIG